MNLYGGMEDCTQFVDFLKNNKLTVYSEFTVTDIDGAYRLQFENEKIIPKIGGGWPEDEDAFSKSFFFEIYDKKGAFYWDLDRENYMDEATFIFQIEKLMHLWKKDINTFKEVRALMM